MCQSACACNQPALFLVPGVRQDVWQETLSREITDQLPYITFPEGSEEHTYLHAQRQKLHGYLPSRQPNFTEKLELPSLQDFGALLEEQSKEIDPGERLRRRF